MSDHHRRIAVCPGTYDPVTYGHIDIIARASRLFDEVIVSVTTGSVKKRPMFDAEERIGFVETSVAHLDNVRVEGFNSLDHGTRADARRLGHGKRSESHL